MDNQQEQVLDSSREQKQEPMRKNVDFATYVKEVSMDIDYAEAWIDDSQQQ